MVTFDSLAAGEDRIAVVGLGYVGLPLAVQLSRKFDVVGYDLKTRRIQELKAGIDRTLEVEEQALRSARIEYTDNPEALKACRLIIIAEVKQKAPAAPSAPAAKPHLAVAKWAPPKLKLSPLTFIMISPPMIAMTR